MKVYGESSAVLAWLFEEPETGRKVAEILAAAETIVASDLTIVECRRVIHRATSTGQLTSEQSTSLLAALGKAAAHWMRSSVTQDVLEVASGRFPIEPLRTLDAIHLATALRIRLAIPDLRILTLDNRVRVNGEAMGFQIC